MRNFKTKMGLSVLAIACLGAGVMNLQPSVSANAEDTIETTTYVAMANGASVCLKDDFSGIRWTTNVDREKLEEQFQGQTLKYGVLVAPNVAATELTVETAGAMNLVAPASFMSSEATKFYTVINYDDILANYEGELSAEEVLAKAYALELTARAYVEVEGVYYYADMSGVNTARSARQVAIAAELAGEIDEKFRSSENEKDQAKADKAENYYGMTEQYVPAVKSIGAVGTTVVNLEKLATGNVNAKFASEAVVADDISEVLVGAERMRSTIAYKNGVFAFTVLEGQNLPTGETYATVFMKDGTILTYPLVCATKVINAKEDLAMFTSKGDDGTNSTKVKTEGWLENYWDASQEQSGYYVLGKDIEAQGYVHGSKNKDGSWNTSTWNGPVEYRNKPIGLTGTFNGMGYAIKDMEIGGEREGFFGIVNGGTVKNVAFLDVQAEGEQKYVLANYLYKATVENVYIKTDAYETDEAGKVTSKGFPMQNCAGMANLAAGNTQIKSCLIHFATTNTTATTFSGRSPTGVMFNAYNSSFDCTDVYAVSDNLIGSYTHTLMYGTTIDTEDGDTYAENKRLWLAENETSRECTDGTILQFAPDLSSTNEDGTPTTAPANNKGKKTLKDPDLDLKIHNDSTRPRVVMMGAYRYNSLAIMYKYNTTYTNLANTGCWYLNESNELVWGKKA